MFKELVKYTFVAGLWLGLLATVPAWAGSKGVSSMDSLSDIPDIPVGPYKVGFQSIINVDLTEGPVNISVWYPVSPDTVGQPLSEYTTYSGFPQVSDVYGIPTTRTVYQDAPALPGRLPVVYFFHGDLKNPDVSRFLYAQTGEVLATHGIIYVTFNRQNSRSIAEANALIDYMQNQSDFMESIDPERIGIEGQSAGGINGSQIAATDPNVKGFVSNDGFSPDYVPNVPIMRFGTSYIGLTGQDQDLLHKSAGRPLIFLTSHRFRHLGLYDNLCDSINGLRELALQQVNDPAYEPLLDPLNNVNGVDAYALWKINSSGITGGDHACNTELWAHPVPSDAFSANYGRYIRSDIQTKFAVLYRVAFWNKVFFNDSSSDYLFDRQWFYDHFDRNVIQLRGGL